MAAAKDDEIMCQKRYFFLFAGLVVAGLSPYAWAEGGCPAGFEPWRVPIRSTDDCMPIPDYDQPEEPISRAASEPQWLSRWGAIAIGSTASGGGVGTTTDQRSRRKAESVAMKQCRDTGGGKDCKVFSYYDQCAVVAWGTRSYVIRSAASIERASQVALEQCRAKTDDCQIYYSACSLPQPIR
jgi:hypothetical protein